MPWKKNVGEVDSNIRLFSGLVVMALAFFAAGFLQGLLMVIGFYLVMTSVIGICPVYLVMRKDTSKTEGKHL